MIIDQNEIDSLLNAAENLVDQAGPAPETSTTTASATATAAPPPSAARLSTNNNLPSAVRRVLRIKVPVIAQLARRTLSLNGARRLSLGMIIEFDKHVDDHLDLHINNQLVARGEAVKVGEFFGLRLTQICDRVTRIKSLNRRPQ